MDFIDFEDENIDVVVLDFMVIINEYFVMVLIMLNLFVLCEIVVEVLNVFWDDIGGFEGVK